MKRVISCLLPLLFLLPLLHAQAKTFLRVYDAGGKKISKGYLTATTDSSFVLLNGKKQTEIAVTQTGFIKSKRSTYNRVLTTPLMVVTIVVVMTVVIAGVVMLAISHPHINNGKYKSSGPGLSKQVKPLKEYRINGSLETWPAQRLLLNRLL